MGIALAPAKSVILVVEDEPLLRMMAVDLVEAAGFTAIEASGADQAVAILESRDDIRVVFSDIDMPGDMDGMKLAAAIRDRWPPIELILTSGHCRPCQADLPERSVFFPKPYPRDQVTATMQRMAA